MFLKGLFDSGYKELKRVEKIADQIEALADDYKKLSDEDAIKVWIPKSLYEQIYKRKCLGYCCWSEKGCDFRQPDYWC